MYKSKIYYWFFVAFCQILGKSILTMPWPYALLQRWGGCAEKRELVVFQPNYISCATKTKIAIDEQDNGEEMWNRERDRSENDRVFLMHMCALIHDVTFLYAGIAQWGFLLSVLSVIMPRWAEPRRHTVVCLCMCHSVCAWCSESLVKKLALILAEHGDIDSCFKTNYKNLSFKAVFVSYGVICLPWWLLLAVYFTLKTKLPTAGCLVVCRLDFYYRIAAQVRRNCVKKLAGYGKASHSHADVVDTPSNSHTLWSALLGFCLHSCSFWNNTAVLVNANSKTRIIAAL